MLASRSRLAACSLLFVTALLAPAAPAAPSPPDAGWYAVEFKQRISDDVRQQVAASGLVLGDFLPPRSYVAWGVPQAAQRADVVPGVGTVVQLQPDAKILATAAAGGALSITVAQPRTDDAVRFLEGVGQVLGAIHDDALTSRIVATVSSSDVPTIAARPEVLYVMPAAGPPVALDEASAQVVAGNVDEAGIGVPGYRGWLDEHDLDGAGVRVSVIDSGVDERHPDLAGRVVEHLSYTTLPSSDRTTHGTHVAGIVGGDPALAARPADEQGRLYGLGMAPAVEILDQQLLGSSLRLEPFDHRVLARDAWHRGVRVTNNSWTLGVEERPGYDDLARAFDVLIRDADPELAGDQQVLFVFAAGNDPDFVSTPQEAKNILVVGATESGRGLLPRDVSDTEAVTSFSARGPTLDGRMFPTVVAPGESVVSARATAGGDQCVPPAGGAGLYVSCSGTSMAAPHATGAAALIQQWFAREHGSAPSPALMKALLVSSAVDIGVSDVPNPAEGWGRIDVGALLAEPPGLVVDQRDVLGGPDEVATYEVQVEQGASPLRVTLAWTDAPGSPAASHALVNDLDLVVEQLAADGTVLRRWRGNVFAQGASVSGGAADRLNNLENVHVEAPAAGRYRIGVVAHDIPGDGVPAAADPTDQDFALVVRGGGAESQEPPASTLDLTSVSADGSSVRVAGQLTLAEDATGPVTVAVDPQGDLVASNSGGDLGASTIEADLDARTLTFRLEFHDTPGAPSSAYAWSFTVGGDDSSRYWLGAGREGTDYPPRTEPWTALCSGPQRICAEPLGGSVGADAIEWVLPLDLVTPALAPGSVLGPGSAWGAAQVQYLSAAATLEGYPLDAATSFRGYRLPGGIDVAVTPQGVRPDPADYEPTGAVDPASGRFDATSELPGASGPQTVWVRSCWGRTTAPRCVEASAGLG